MPSLCLEPVSKPKKITTNVLGDPRKNLLSDQKLHALKTRQLYVIVCRGFLNLMEIKILKDESLTRKPSH